MITIIDYGAGNLFSIKNALNYLGFESEISGDKEKICLAEKLVLPGVGAFSDAMKMLNNSGLSDIIKTEVKKKPLLGICLGMQILFEKGFEFEETEGLGLIKGSVEKIKASNLNIPQMGWNNLKKNEGCKLSNSFNDGDYVYFVHSYAAVCNDENIAAYCDYGEKIPALVFSGNVYGCQFHPEKSGETGLNILKDFIEL